MAIINASLYEGHARDWGGLLGRWLVSHVVVVLAGGIGAALTAKS